MHADHLARPQKITDGTRTIVWDGVFAPFGEVHAVTGSIVNVLMFPGQVYDPETGLTQNWHRDYDANIGRYLQSDPIGIGGGINTYAYVGGNPMAYVDPDGRFAFLAPLLGAAALGAFENLMLQLWDNGGRWECVDWEQVIISAGVGAATGAAFKAVQTAVRWARMGKEFVTPGKNWRFALFGNRTGHPTGELPHYHRRGPGGIGRHRPWDSKPSDRSWWSRF